MKYVRLLNTIDTDDVAEFGGKSCSLGEMIQNDIPVPPGFAINVRAQKEFQGTSFSTEFKSDLEKLFTELKLERVAVRSSAIAEDSADASWAGQLETYLNVDFKGLEDSIRNCWDSIQSVHAQAYAKHTGVPDSDLFVGVTIQAMAQSDVSGVMFTVDPISQDKHLIVIEGLYGLGELLVQGVVTPDRFTVDTSHWAIVNTFIGQKDRKLVYENGANIEKSVPDTDRRLPVLTMDQAIQLAKLGKTIEAHYCTPQDIEWSLVDDMFYIVQSRPITSLL